MSVGLVVSFMLKCFVLFVNFEPFLNVSWYQLLLVPSGGTEYSFAMRHHARVNEGLNITSVVGE